MSARQLRRLATASAALGTVVLLTLATACDRSRPGDAGGAASGDDLGRAGSDSAATGSAESNDSVLRKVPTAPTRSSPHDERGRDTTGR
jgi:hypothetical protein